ncbi:hypothetical protein Scep_024790 [Stephania cephalantha]|uniref:Aminotransferase-like plant mobile domain-containing protein n=1 Tax=Stephania cephalantha TaxID=152367 RepID=A0AAP0EZZ6_9MAGN
MHCGECTITLQDVQVQLGLPIEGMPVTGTTDADYADVCERLLGRTPGGDDVVGCKLKVDWLERNVPSIDDDSDEESVRRYVRSYILQLIGGCLFADKSNRFVHLMFLPLLEDFQLAGQYSWGSACLAYLYRELCRGSRAGAHEVAGASILLQLWAWDRFPFIAPRRLRVSRAQQRTVDGQNMLMDVPLGHRYESRFVINLHKNLDHLHLS